MSAPEHACASALRTGLARYLPPLLRDFLGSVRVGIAGAGGLGSNVAFLLARSGVRRFTIADHDRVEASNLNRQAFFPEDVGFLKAEALTRHLRRLDEGISVDMYGGKVTRANALSLFAGCAAVVEAFDAAPDKAMLFETMAGSDIFYVGASGLAGCGGPPMEVRRVGANAVIVGDFVSEVDEGLPPLAPRVMQAAALEADQVLGYLLELCGAQGISTEGSL